MGPTSPLTSPKYPCQNCYRLYCSSVCATATAKWIRSLRLRSVNAASRLRGVVWTGLDVTRVTFSAWRTLLLTHLMVHSLRKPYYCFFCVHFQSIHYNYCHNFVYSLRLMYVKTTFVKMRTCVLKIKHALCVCWNYSSPSCNDELRTERPADPCGYKDSGCLKSVLFSEQFPTSPIHVRPLN